jgi:hypothetical protein
MTGILLLVAKAQAGVSIRGTSLCLGINMNLNKKAERCRAKLRTFVAQSCDFNRLGFFNYSPLLQCVFQT